ncbi:MAG: hypothetical protein VW443_00535 [Pseudomonadales bacterium]|jgi:hypothetical protein
MAHSSQLAKNIVPIVREYIEARLSEFAVKIEEALFRKLNKPQQKVEIPDLDDFRRRLEYIEMRYSEEDKYKLTRGKIFQLMHDLGID